MAHFRQIARMHDWTSCIWDNWLGICVILNINKYSTTCIFVLNIEPRVFFIKKEEKHCWLEPAATVVATSEDFVQAKCQSWGKPIDQLVIRNGHVRFETSNNVKSHTWHDEQTPASYKLSKNREMMKIALYGFHKLSAFGQWSNFFNAEYCTC